MTRRWILAAALAALGTTVLASGQFQAIPGTRDSSPAAATPNGSAARLGRQAAIDKVLASRRQVVRVDRSEAKLVQGESLTEVGITGIAGGRNYWAVAVAGELVPEFDVIGTRNRWGLFVLESDMGNIEAVRQGRAEDWPPGFDALRDLSR